jgi:hypothetical protein
VLLFVFHIIFSLKDRILYFIYPHFDTCAEKGCTLTNGIRRGGMEEKGSRSAELYCIHALNIHKKCMFCTRNVYTFYG